MDSLDQRPQIMPCLLPYTPCSRREVPGMFIDKETENIKKQMNNQTELDIFDGNF